MDSSTKRIVIIGILISLVALPIIAIGVPSLLGGIARKPAPEFSREQLEEVLSEVLPPGSAETAPEATDPASH